MLTKDFILKNAKVLLISPYKKDFEAMKDYGFERISLYTSFLEASNKFQIYPKDLSRYDIIVERNIPLRRSGRIDLYHLFWNLDREKVVRVVLDSEFFYDKEKEMEMLCCILEGEKCKDVSYSAVFSKVIDNVQEKKLDIKEPLKIDNNTNQSFITPKDLKILYFFTGTEKQEKEVFRKAARKLGISVVFQEVGKNSKKALQKIPLYDIVFAPESLRYLYSLLYSFKMNSNGKKVDSQILVTYQDRILKTTEDHLIECYLIQLETIYKKENFIGRTKEEYHLIFCDAFYKAKSILSSILNQYKDFKFQEDEKNLQNFDFPISSFYELEYIQKEKEKMEEQKAIWGIFQKYEQLLSIMEDFFNYRAEKYVTKDPYGLKIQKLEEKGGYCVETLHNGKVRGSITIFSQFIGCFGVRLGTKVEGVLGPEEIVAFGIDNEQNNQMKKPNDKQSALFFSIYQKANRILKPLIEKAKIKEEKELPEEMQRKRNRI